MSEQVNINVNETNENINIISTEVVEVIDINVSETIEEVTLNITEEVIQVNINKVTGGGGNQNLQEVTDNGANTTNQMQINGVNVATINDIPEAQVNSDWNANSGIAEILNKPFIPINTSDLTNDSNFVSDANYTHTDNNFTNTLKTKLDGIADGAEVNVNADWNATSGDAQILNKPTIPSLTGYVPYTGATNNVNLGEFELKAGQVTLDTTPTGTSAVATTIWNDSLGTSETTLKGGNVILKNGVDLVARVVNKVTPNTTLTKAQYQVVRISGAQGQRLAVELAQANNDNNSADTLGIVIETIATNQEGFILTIGQLEGINTTGSLQSETWADGDVLYLSPTTAGKITNIKPTGATGHIVVLGYVEHAHITQGKIYVKIMNGWELDELHNVYIDTPLNNQGLTYETSTSLWKNKTIDKTFVGLGNVDNTSDASKPVSTATQTALNLKENTITAGTTSQYYRGDKTFQTLNKSAVGLSNVDNTSDVNKPVSTAQQSAIDAKVADSITDGVTTIAPSQNAVFDALALKQAILSYTPYRNIQTSQTVHTGTTVETLIFTATIPAAAFNSTDIIKVLFGVNKSTALGTYTLRLRVNTTNTISGAPTIALYSGTATAQVNVMQRNYNLNSGNLYGFMFATSGMTDIAAVGGSLGSTTLNPANQFYIFGTILLNNSGDSIVGNMLSISN